MRCEWNTGHETDLPTHYRVQLQDLDTGEVSAVNTSGAAVTFPVNATLNNLHRIQIIAANPLNVSASEAAIFRLEDIVLPLTPEIKKIHVSDTKLTIYINWRNQTSRQRHCEVEYKTPRRPEWSLAGKEININNTVSLRKMRKADSVRIRCREEFGKSYWSKWSAPHPVPFTAPEEIPNVWRILGRKFPDGAQEVTILIASYPDDSPRINISGYEVYYYHHGVRTGVRRCPPAGVQCVALIPGGVQTVFIAAYNPYGFSPAMDLPVQEDEGSGPEEVTAQSIDRTSLSVQWRPPRRSAERVRSYLIQWISDNCDGKHRNVSWHKTAPEQRNFTITGNVTPGQRVTVTVYAVYGASVSSPSVVYGYTQEREPAAGPSPIKIVTSLLDARLEWAEVPQCDRRGFITGYTVYIRQNPNGSRFTYEVHGSTRQLLFKKFNPDARYSVCISASTRAGEGPADHCTNFHHDEDVSSYTGLLLGMAFGVIALTGVILTLSKIRKRVKKTLILLLPKFLHEEYPRVERSSAVRSLQSDKEDPEPLRSLLPDDPESVEIEELLKEETSPPLTSTDPTEDPDNMMEAPLIPTNDMEVPEHTLGGYRPQIAKVTSQIRDSYCSPSDMLDLQRMVIRSRNPEIPSNNLLLSNITEDLFKGMSPNGSDLGDVLLQFTPDPTLHSLWESQTFMERLVMADGPGDTMDFTPSLPEEPDGTKSYFPQIVSREF
ncbi:interleukin-27 receptor subunit alpha-like isoform X2 [Engystomops pustulosus]